MLFIDALYGWTVKFTHVLLEELAVDRVANPDSRIISIRALSVVFIM